MAYKLYIQYDELNEEGELSRIGEFTIGTVTTLEMATQVIEHIESLFNKPDWPYWINPVFWEGCDVFVSSNDEDFVYNDGQWLKIN